jgi:hypothetical protein
MKRSHKIENSQDLTGKDPESLYESSNKPVGATQIKLTKNKYYNIITTC